MIKLRDILNESIDFDNFKKLIDEFEGRDLEFVTAQTITHLLNTFREIKSTQEKKLAVKILIKAGLLKRVKAAI